MNNIFQFIQDKKGKKIPLEYKLLNNLLTEDDLIYNGDLDLFKSNIKSLPDNLTVNGNLDLYCSKIKKLPNNLTVNGNLYLYGSKIKKLPDNLYVDGFLCIRHTDISKLPDDLYVGGNIYCSGTPLMNKIRIEKSLLIKYQKQIKGNIFYEWHL